MKFHRVGAVAERVLRQLWHDRRVLAFMLLLPAVAMILFGYSFSGDIKGVRVGFIDEDKTDLTASILENLEKDDALVVRVVAPGRDPERLLLDEGYQAVVRIPAKFTSLYYAHFAMGVATSAQGRIDLALDESDPQIAAAVQKSLADALMALGEGGPVDVQIKDLYGVEVRFIDSFAPAIMGMVVAMISTVLTLLSIVREKVDGTFARVWVSPVRRGEFILGYVLAFGLIALVQSLVVLAVGSLVFHIVINGSIFWASLCVILFAVGSVGLGTLLSALAQTESQAIIFFPLVTLPSVLLSGMMWPVQAIPALLRPLSYLIPLTYSNRLLRAVMVKGLAPWQEPVGLVGVIAFVVLTVVAASLVLRQRGRSAE
jgi:ABC-2 type transport system permease protein